MLNVAGMQSNQVEDALPGNVEPFDKAKEREWISRQLLEAMPALERLALTLARSRADADDLVQGTCLRVLQRVVRPRGSESSDVIGLFIRIMKNLHIDELRSRTRNSPIGEREFAAPSSETVAHWRRVSDEALGKAVGSLHSTQRAAWELTQSRELKQAEIAALLGIRPATVASRIHRMRLALRDRLRNDLNVRLDRETSVEERLAPI